MLRYIVCNQIDDNSVFFVSDSMEKHLGIGTTIRIDPLIARILLAESINIISHNETTRHGLLWIIHGRDQNREERGKM